MAFGEAFDNLTMNQRCLMVFTCWWFSSHCTCTSIITWNVLLSQKVILIRQMGKIFHFQLNGVSFFALGVQHEACAIDSYSEEWWILDAVEKIVVYETSIVDCDQESFSNWQICTSWFRHQWRCQVMGKWCSIWWHGWYELDFIETVTTNVLRCVCLVL